MPLPKQIRCADCTQAVESDFYLERGILMCTSAHFASCAYTFDGDHTRACFYQYDEGGGFFVGPNFGCVHFEPKG